jgi:hypothetical protein
VDFVKSITNPVEGDRREAEAWLARTLRWERILGELRDSGTDPSADGQGHATVPDERVRRPEAA